MKQPDWKQCELEAAWGVLCGLTACFAVAFGGAPEWVPPVMAIGGFLVAFLAEWRWGPTDARERMEAVVVSALTGTVLLGLAVTAASWLAPHLGPAPTPSG